MNNEVIMKFVAGFLSNIEVQKLINIIANRKPNKIPTKFHKKLVGNILYF